MLIIRQEQINTLLQSQQDTLAHEIGLSLKRKLSFFQYYSDKQVTEWVNKQIQYLQANNIKSKENILTIIDIIALYGDRFERIDDSSWALDIIENKEKNEDIRCENLVEAHDEYVLEKD